MVLLRLQELGLKDCVIDVRDQCNLTSQIRVILVQLSSQPVQLLICQRPGEVVWHHETKDLARGRGFAPRALPFASDFSGKKQAQVMATLPLWQLNLKHHWELLHVRQQKLAPGGVHGAQLQIRLKLLQVLPQCELVVSPGDCTVGLKATQRFSALTLPLLLPGLTQGASLETTHRQIEATPGKGVRIEVDCYAPLLSSAVPFIR
mmetsp:Transcript_10565/g.30100  ORF Transcript_10565/g.30100 Transcript_10565/m.30100 type:complete len:205 (+) Transcript_10565:744-1358(+)